MSTLNRFCKLFIVVITVLLGCEKQNVTLVLDNYGLIDTLSNNYDFVVEVNKQIYDEYYNYSDTSNNRYYLDINYDGIRDIKIMASLSASSGGLNQSSATIETLNSSILFATIEKVDTFCTYTENSGTINKFHSENYKFDKEYNSSLMLSIENNLYPLILNVNDTIDDNIYWTQVFYYLNYANNSYAGFAGSDRYITNIFKGIWYNIDKKYIGLKLSYNSDLYLGWLSIGVNSKIMVYKVALKKIQSD